MLGKYTYLLHSNSPSQPVSVFLVPSAWIWIETDTVGRLLFQVSYGSPSLLVSAPGHAKTCVSYPPLPSKKTPDILELRLQSSKKKEMKSKSLKIQKVDCWQPTKQVPTSVWNEMEDWLHQELSVVGNQIKFYCRTQKKCISVKEKEPVLFSLVLSSWLFERAKASSFVLHFWLLPIWPEASVHSYWLWLQ